MKNKKLFALRGATFTENKTDDIIKRITYLYDAMLSENLLSEDNIVSIIFSVTKDLTAINPAAALRSSGRAQEAALFSAVEPEAGVYHNGVIRVLIHCYLEEDTKVRHIYCNGAEILRPDRIQK